MTADNKTPNIDINDINTFSTKRLTDTILSELSYFVQTIVHQWERPISFLDYLVYDLANAKEGTTINADLLGSAKGAKEISGFLGKSVKNLESLFSTETEPVWFDMVQALDDVLAVSEVFLHGIDLNYAVMCDCGSAQCEMGSDNALNCQKTGIKVKGFPAPLKRAILYLILNAKEAISRHKPENGGEIRIDLAYAEGTVFIVVENNGGKINEEILENIFKPYFTTRKDRKAQGMGLFLAKITAEQRMNGVIFAENTESDGARFIISFPEDGGHEDKQKDQPTILYVDMDSGTKKINCEMLTEHFKEIICASNGIEAITEFMTKDPDIVIIGKLPKMNNLLLAETIKKISLQKPVILITDLDIPEEQRGFIDKIVKPPFSKLDILDAIFDFQ